MVDSDLWRDLGCQLGDGLLTLAGLWGDAGVVHMALLDASQGELAISEVGLRLTRRRGRLIESRSGDSLIALEEAVEAVQAATDFLEAVE